MRKMLLIKGWHLFIIFLVTLGFSSSMPGDILKIVCIIFFVFYFYSIAHLLFPKLPTGHGLNIKLFDLNLIAAFIYFIASPSARIAGYSIDPSTYHHSIWWLALFFPLVFLLSFAVFYCFYWLAKCVVTIEIGREVSFSDFAPSFFFFWIFPIGVLFIVPRFQQIFKNRVE